MCERVTEVHLLSDRPQQRDGCVGSLVYNGCLTGWWALALACCFLHTFSLPLPVFSSLQAVGVNSLPFLPKCRLSIATLYPSFSSNPSMHVVFADCKFDRSSEGETQRERNQTISSIRQPTPTYVWTIYHLHQLSQFSSFSRRHLCSQVENILFTTKAEKPFSFEEQKASTSFWGLFVSRGGSLSAFSALIDPSVCLKFAKATQCPLM